MTTKDLLPLLRHPRAVVRRQAVLALAGYRDDEQVLQALHLQYFIDSSLREILLDVIAHGV